MKEGASVHPRHAPCCVTGVQLVERSRATLVTLVKSIWTLENKMKRCGLDVPSVHECGKAQEGTSDFFIGARGGLVHERGHSGPCHGACQDPEPSLIVVCKTNVHQRSVSYK